MDSYRRYDILITDFLVSDQLDDVDLWSRNIIEVLNENISYL
jgi:hypothetical protein